MLTAGWLHVQLVTVPQDALVAAADRVRVGGAAALASPGHEWTATGGSDSSKRLLKAQKLLKLTGV